MSTQTTVYEAFKIIYRVYQKFRQFDFDSLILATPPSAPKMAKIYQKYQLTLFSKIKFKSRIQMIQVGQAQLAETLLWGFGFRL